jgi:hypothetical protein
MESIRRIQEIDRTKPKHERTYKGRPPTIQPDAVRRLKEDDFRNGKAWYANGQTGSASESGRGAVPTRSTGQSPSTSEPTRVARPRFSRTRCAA